MFLRLKKINKVNIRVIDSDHLAWLLSEAFLCKFGNSTVVGVSGSELKAISGEHFMIF